MLYFSHDPTDTISSQLTEEAIRHFSSKRHTSLDFKITTTNVKDEKYFLGLDGRTDLQITRIRTGFEWFFPQLIYSFPKEDQCRRYRVRYSFFSTVFVVILLWGLFASAYDLFIEGESAKDLIQMLLLCVIFVALTILEMTLTKRKIRKAAEHIRPNL
jgi:hypothetical protein